MSQEVGQEIPLCVDLDGTLIRSDLLLESLIALFRSRPLSLLLLPFWLFRGRSYLKMQIARRVEFNASILPYNGEILEFLRGERAKGRRLVLVTASDRYHAEHVAQHLGLFSEVLASDGVSNLKAAEKRKRLDASYGERGYDYIGDADADIPVWQGAREALFVGDNRKRSCLERDGVLFAKVFSKDSLNAGWKVWFRALRVHQWAKNTLIFVPLFLSHRFELESFLSVVAAFFAFSLVASANYLLNDLVDLDFDRQHPTKRNRPLASGRLFIGYGIAVVPFLLGISVVTLWFLPLLVAGSIALYLMITLLYSIVLKRLVLIDVIVLAGLYTLRIIAGAFAIEADLTFWLLAFSMFLFLSLALVKRYSELVLLSSANLESNNSGVINGRGYRAEDLPILHSLGSGSGLLAVLVFALYINSPEIKALYQVPEVLWFALPVLQYWISRLWLLAHRRLIHEDPVLFALQDRTSLFLATILMTLVWLAAVGV